MNSYKIPSPLRSLLQIMQRILIKKWAFLRWYLGAPVKFNFIFFYADNKEHKAKSITLNIHRQKTLLNTLFITYATPKSRHSHLLFAFFLSKSKGKERKRNVRVEEFICRILLINNECRLKGKKLLQKHRQERKFSANKAREVNLNWIIYFQYCMRTLV